MTMESTARLMAVALAVAGVASAGQGEKAKGRQGVKVFILAGQSNMQGKGTIEHLQQVVRENPQRYGHLQRNGRWVERDDVWVDYLSDRGRKQGKLTVGYATPEDRIGPELGFGTVIGDALAEPVLIVKYAVGGRAIALEFRPPSSGAIDPCSIPATLQEQIESGRKEPGREYHLMMTHIKNVLANLRASVPSYDGGSVELAGFVWFQGWNDQYNGFEAHYQ